ncbi:unnamed protein product, partial [Meganyctiphanes norvegica]
YVNNCQNRSLDAYMSECWDKETSPVNPPKIFRKCELADVLENKHNMPRDQVKSWVCIAEYESSFNAGHINNLNFEGSKDYGLFHISNKFWCKDDDENPNFKNVCNMSCSNFVDQDLTDDLDCLKVIIDDTESWKGEGTGLTSWTDYIDNCQDGNLDEYLLECEAEKPSPISPKIFEKCELADVLENKHNMPRNQVKSWVCIAEYESSFNAGHINNLNFEGSKDYGLFHISNKFWCKDDDENPNFKSVCNMPCTNFVDQDLTDDLDCLKVIIDDTESWKGEGTGLTSWTSYVNNCQNRSLDVYMSECWDKETSSVNPPKIFRKCELADVLENKHNMPRDQVKSWVCIAEYESSFNAGHINNLNFEGSKDYGLFHISNKFWCKDDDENPNFKNVCNMPCSNFVDQDLSDDLDCLKVIIDDTESWKGEGTGLT